MDSVVPGESTGGVKVAEVFSEGILSFPCCMPLMTVL